MLKLVILLVLGICMTTDAQVGHRKADAQSDANWAKDVSEQAE